MGDEFVWMKGNGINKAVDPCGEVIPEDIVNTDEDIFIHSNT